MTASLHLPAVLRRVHLPSRITDRIPGVGADTWTPVDPAAAVRPEPWRPSAAELAAYAGRWYSDELETVYTLVVQGDRLVARHRRHGDLPLTPVEPGVFAGGQWFLGRVRFEPDATGAPAVMRVSAGRVRNVRFERLR